MQKGKANAAIDRSRNGSTGSATMAQFVAAANMDPTNSICENLHGRGISRKSGRISGRQHSSNPLLAESSMSDQSRDLNESKKEAEKKQPRPVELSDEQLDAITGGASQPPPPPPGGGSGGVQPN